MMAREVANPLRMLSAYLITNATIMPPIAEEEKDREEGLSLDGIRDEVREEQKEERSSTLANDGSNSPKGIASKESISNYFIELSVAIH